MSRLEAKARIHDYLAGESGLDSPSRDNLRRQRVLLDPETIIIGGTGFITASKGTELLYHAQSVLQQMLPKHSIAAVYVGHMREAGSSIDARAAADLKARYNGPGQFFLDTYLPRDMLAALLRALDIYFYWPGDCTQSGIIAHALGAGATIACRDMEGVGETVKMAGGLTSANFEELILKIRQTIVDPGLRVEIAESALAYAEEFSWKNQLLRHLELAEDLCPSGARRLTDVMWADAGPAEISTLLRVGSTV
jgi:glycosyltransferase involved in cell wall biosynthesis